MSVNCATWTSERVELLKRCLQAGFSCSQTAREIGVTRNAVIGKINRLGLSRPKDLIARQLEQRRAANDAEQNLAVFRGSAHWVLRREVQFGPLSQCSAALGDLRGPTHMRRSCLTLQLWCADRVFQTEAL
jgi:GcrA cell cycle regulator